MARSLIYKFTLNMWLMGRADENFINGQVKMGRLKQNEANSIMSNPQKR